MLFQRCSRRTPRRARLCWLFVVVLTAMMTSVLAVSSSVFEEAYDEWETQERKFYATYRAGDPYPPAETATTLPGTHPLRGVADEGTTGDDEERLGASVKDEKRSSVVSLPNDERTKKGSREEKATQQAAQLSANRNRYRAQPTTNNDDALPQGRTSQQSVVDDDNAAASDDALRSGGADGGVVATQQPPSAFSSSSTRTKPSFSEVCGKDSADRCNNPNPFATTFCLVGKKDALSPECRDYVTAKVNCYLSTSKLCKDAPSQLKCLYAHRNQGSLPRMCTHTKFFEYIMSGVSVADVLLDTRNGDDAA